MPRVLCLLSAVLVAVGCVVVGGCGGEDEAPVSPSDVVGTWVLNKEATSAALLAAADAVDGDGGESGSTLRCDPKEWPERLRDLQAEWRMFSEAVLNGDLRVEVTFGADGTLSRTFTAYGEDKTRSGTWSLDEDVIVTVVGDRPGESQSETRYRNGVIEALDPFTGLTLWVFRRQQDEPAR